MKIGSISEDLIHEKRIAITPEIVKKYTSLGFQISLSENYGSHLRISDNDYLDQGAKLLKDDEEIIGNSDIITQLGLPSDKNISLINESKILIGVLNPYENKEKLSKLIEKKINIF